MKKANVNERTMKGFVRESESGAKGGRAIPPSGPMKNIKHTMLFQKDKLVKGKEREEKRKEILQDAQRDK